MLPNSEKFYAWIIIAVSSIFVIISVVTIYNVVTNKEIEERPTYQKLPPKMVALAPEPYIINKALVQAPITDDEFELFHKTARTVTPLFAGNKWIERLTPLTVSPIIIKETKEKALNFEQSLENTTISKAKGVEVENPELKTCEFNLRWCVKYCEFSSQQDNKLERQDPAKYKCTTASSIANVEYIFNSDDLGVINSNSLQAKYIWLKNINTKKWKLAEIQINFNGQALDKEETKEKDSETLDSNQLNELEENSSLENDIEQDIENSVPNENPEDSLSNNPDEFIE